MKLTKEQTDIIHSTGDIRINAVAGSGKTTTVIEYARAHFFYTEYWGDKI